MNRQKQKVKLSKKTTNNTVYINTPSISVVQNEVGF
jgi:hypothetical protein